MSASFVRQMDWKEHRRKSVKKECKTWTKTSLGMLPKMVNCCSLFLSICLLFPGDDPSLARLLKGNCSMYLSRVLCEIYSSWKYSYDKVSQTPSRRVLGRKWKKKKERRRGHWESRESSWLWVWCITRVPIKGWQNKSITASSCTLFRLRLISFYAVTHLVFFYENTHSSLRLLLISCLSLLL